MFRKLRNKFILTNMLITTAILLVAFGAIFVSTAISSARPHEMRPRDDMISAEMREMVRSEIEQDRNERLAKLALTLVLVGVGTELLVFAASYYFAEKSIEPVRNAYISQKDFIANASHELKTPIAAIRANFEALDTVEEPWTSNIDTELSRADQLVQDLLTLVRTEDVTRMDKKRNVNLAAVVRKKIEIMEPRLEGKDLAMDIPEELETEIYARDYEQIVNILLDNAAKYAKSKVKVEMKDGELRVGNDGKTIPPEKLAKIFERFYQVDKTASGTGLGLAIAKAVADKHGWKLTASSEFEAKILT